MSSFHTSNHRRNLSKARCRVRRTFASFSSSFALWKLGASWRRKVGWVRSEEVRVESVG
jgi:hypothetical protein